MLEMNPDIVCLLILQAHDFHAKETLRISDEPVILGGDKDFPMQPSYEEDVFYQSIKNTIEDLEPDQQESLVALMWLGRGDYELEEWNAVLEVAHERHNERTAEYLIGTPLLADYLEEGLSQLGYQCGE